jgi:hypothetical protein
LSARGTFSHAAGQEPRNQSGRVESHWLIFAIQPAKLNQIFRKMPVLLMSYIPARNTVVALRTLFDP